MKYRFCLLIVVGFLAVCATGFAQTKSKPQPELDRGIVAE